MQWKIAVLVLLLGNAASGAGVTGDYNGDRKVDPALYDQSKANWYILASNRMQTIQFGWSDTLPVPGDYNGDGRTEVACLDPASWTWYLRGTNGMTTRQFGFSGCVPVPGDYDGDGRDDLAVFDPGTVTWYIKPSSGGGMRVIVWGSPGSLPFPIDFDHDGKTDPVVFHPHGRIFGLGSVPGETNLEVSVPAYFWPVTFDNTVYPWVPVWPVGPDGQLVHLDTHLLPADYDGDGDDDYVEYQNGVWSGLPGGTRQFGFSGAIPLYRPHLILRQAEASLYSKAKPKPGFWSFSGQGSLTVQLTADGVGRRIVYSRDNYAYYDIPFKPSRGYFARAWGSLSGSGGHCPTDGYDLRGLFLSGTQAVGIVRYGHACTQTGAEIFRAESW